MQVTVELNQNVNFSATSGSGHTIQMDGPPDFGGENLGARPMETLLMGMGGCASFDVVHDSCIAEITAERAEVDPKVFVAIHLHFTVSGEGLSEKAVAKAVELSAEKYCSASIMLGKTAKVTHTFNLV